jgi:hypothetical protein
MTDTNLEWADNILNTDPIFPWFISYQNENEYWIHYNLNYLINMERRKKTFDFGFCYLSIQNNDILHANILIYDFNNLTIERFDPYGNTVVFDKLLDDVLEEELTWNTGFTYLKPSDYMPVAGFQSISDELNPLNQKSGDFGGYCLAWCTWYLEHKIKNHKINKNITSKILVDKLIKKISLSNTTFNEYIRNYANNLNLFRIKYLKDAGVDENKISNIYNDIYTDNKLDKYIINKFNSY